MACKRLCVLVAAVLACVGAAVWGQGEGPHDALILELGVPGGPFEALEIGKPGGTIHLAAYGDPSGWNPVVTFESIIVDACGLFLRGLIGWHESTGEMYPELARSWDISEDGMQITFHLRRGLTWSDGAPFTADDVIFTFNDVHLNEDVDSTLRAAMRLPNGDFPTIEKLDDYTIRVTASEVYRLLFGLFGAFILPRHVLADSVHRLNPDVPAGTFNAAWSAGTPLDEIIGMGPYVLESHVVGQQISLRRNPAFYHFDQAGNRLPYVDRIIFTVCDNHDVSFLQFLNGQLDGISVDAGNLPVLRVRAGETGVRVFTSGTKNDLQFLALNQDVEDEHLRTLFRKLAFRQAVAHAIDRMSIIEIGYHGNAVPIWSPVWIRSPYYAGREEYGGPITERDAVIYEFDLEKASQLLDACGVFDTDGDGWREFEDGTPVSFRMNWPTQWGLQAAAPLIIADDLAKLGVRVILDALSWNLHIERLLSGKGYQAAMIGLSGARDPGRAGPFRSDGEIHLWHYSAAKGDIYPHEARIDELLDLALKTYDADEAFEFYKEFQILFAQEDLGLIFTYSPSTAYAFYNRFGNAQMFVQAETIWGGQVSELIYVLEAG